MDILRQNNIKAIILAGSRDFGRCPLASRFPPALWPIAGKPALEHLLLQLFSQGVTQAVICSNGDSALLQKAIPPIDSISLKFLNEPLPAGTAGCIRDAAEGDQNCLYLILPAGIVSPLNIASLIKSHQRRYSDLTIMLNPSFGNSFSESQPAGIYICGPDIVEYIPPEGYCDIKESLIPAIVRNGKTVHAVKLSRPIVSFNDRQGYLAAIAGYFNNIGNEHHFLPKKLWNGSKDIRVADSAAVSKDSRIYGPVAVFENAVISEKAIIFGPAIIGQNVTIGTNTLIENSVLWDDSTVGKNCRLHNCVVDYKTVVTNNSIVENKALTQRDNGNIQNCLSKSAIYLSSKKDYICSVALPVVNTINTKLLCRLQTFYKANPNIFKELAIGILAAVFLWTYLPEFKNLWNIWQRSDEYSSGLLVPFLALYVLWTKRQKIAPIHIRPTLWGLFFFSAAQMLRYFGMFFMYASAERLSLVLSIASVTLLICGWRLFIKISPVILFLLLMLPLPQSVHNAVMLPLQNLATTSAVFLMQIFGYTVVREGNVIHLNGITVAVAEACNGLRMVTSFFVITALVVLLVRRPWWQKLIILVSGIPVALLCNAMRLTTTAIAFTVLSIERWERIFHDFGGYAMMPLALGVVTFELWFLSKLLPASQK